MFPPPTPLDLRYPLANKIKKYRYTPYVSGKWGLVGKQGCGSCRSQYPTENFKTRRKIISLKYTETSTVQMYKIIVNTSRSGVDA